MKGALCPKLNQKVNVGGKYISPVFSRIEASLYPCSNSTDPSRPCGPIERIDKIIDMFSTISFALGTINPVVNPDQKNYIVNYVEDRNYVLLSKGNLGLRTTIFMNEVTITSD